jgi:hypothetical protein
MGDPARWICPPRPQTSVAQGESRQSGSSVVGIPESGHLISLGLSWVDDYRQSGWSVRIVAN